MPVEMPCTGCGKTLRAPESAAGKKIRCPNCQAIQELPATAGAAASVATASAIASPRPASPAAHSEMWQMKVPGGQTYGPITKAELDSWVKEGRVLGDCHLLRVGSSEWQWSGTIYPGIAAPQAAAPLASAVAYSAAPAYLGAPRPAGNPYADLYTQNPYAAPGYAPQLASSKSRWVAALLAFFTFGLGIHRFYLGHANVGLAILLVTLFACGIGMLWQWVEGFMLLFGAIDRDGEGRLLQ